MTLEVESSHSPTFPSLWAVFWGMCDSLIFVGRQVSSPLLFLSMLAPVRTQRMASLLFSPPTSLCTCAAQASLSLLPATMCQHFPLRGRLSGGEEGRGFSLLTPHQGWHQDCCAMHWKFLVVCILFCTFPNIGGVVFVLWQAVCLTFVQSSRWPLVTWDVILLWGSLGRSSDYSSSAVLVTQCCAQFSSEALLCIIHCRCKWTSCSLACRFCPCTLNMCC